MIAHTKMEILNYNSYGNSYVQDLYPKNYKIKVKEDLNK